MALVTSTMIMKILLLRRDNIRLAFNGTQMAMHRSKVTPTIAQVEKKVAVGTMRYQSWQ